jgi:putative ABC transport system permease protein
MRWIASTTAAAQPLRIIGVDALAVAAIAPALMPVPARKRALRAVRAGQVFLNPAARQLFNGPSLRLQSGLQWREVPWPAAWAPAAGRWP